MKTTRLYIVILLNALLLLSCTGKSEKKPEEAGTEKTESTKTIIVKLSPQTIKDIKLTISPVIMGELSGEIIAPAKLLPNQDLEALVGSMVPGRTGKVYVNIGDYVKKGQALMLIEGLQIGEIKAQFLKAKANLDYTEANYKRLKSLIDQNVGSQKSYQEAKAEVEKAQAEFNAEHKKLHSIGLNEAEFDTSNDNKEHTSGVLSVKSPIDGVVIERNVVIGQLVETNTNAFRIINTSSLLADAQIYESDLKRIVGKPEITLATTAYPDQLFKGRITYISEVVDKDSRTIKIRASVSNQDKKLKPEMFAMMHIPTGKSANALIVPAEAIEKDGKEQFLFVALNDSTFEKRIVETGSSHGENVEIRYGVKEGEKIVIKGAYILKSEMLKSSLEEKGE